MTKAQRNAWIIEHIRILYEDEIRLERHNLSKGKDNGDARENAFLKLRKFLVETGVIPSPSQVSNTPSGPYPAPPQPVELAKTTPKKRMLH